MKCPSCNQADLIETSRDHTIYVGKQPFTRTMQVRSCANCGEYVLSGAHLEDFEQRVAYLLSERPCTSDSLQFLRKVGLGMKATELAALLSVDPSTVSRWEKEHRAIDSALGALVSALVREKLGGGPRLLLGVLQSKAEGPTEQPIRVDAA